MKHSHNKHENKVRLAVRGILIKNNHILLTRHFDHKGEYLIIPGGGVKYGESIQQALVREYKEEIGAKIEIGEVITMRELLPQTHNNDPDIPYVLSLHQFEIFFEVLNIQTDIWQPILDDDQIGHEWIQLKDLGKERFYPTQLAHQLVYGEINKLYQPNLI